MNMDTEVLDLRTILDTPSDELRRKLLIERGWQLQRAEAKSAKERELCDWMLYSAK